MSLYHVFVQNSFNLKWVGKCSSATSVMRVQRAIVMISEFLIWFRNLNALPCTGYGRVEHPVVRQSRCTPNWGAPRPPSRPAGRPLTDKICQTNKCRWRVPWRIRNAGRAQASPTGDSPPPPTAVWRKSVWNNLIGSSIPVANSNALQWICIWSTCSE